MLRPNLANSEIWAKSFDIWSFERPQSQDFPFFLLSDQDTVTVRPRQCYRPTKTMILSSLDSDAI